ncbi:hypothetical protein BpHYR1_051864 [Brachionus plicatilis]|uniref:GRAM domain-containing protein n=1 Tax=Brachionus plicatilis TaxID=10195 RepID=A0A3M7RFW6_BRAPC|nr:hypothetical protein BpHYR1_051864 [Brachionus plicatilis]
MSKQVSDQNSKSLTNLKEIDVNQLSDTKSKFDQLRQSLHLSREHENAPQITNLVNCSSETNLLEKVNGPVDEPKKSPEIFDSSLKYLAAYRCYYWSKNDNIRKGKIFLTSNELFFKCSRLPFVKLRLHFAEIINVVKIKNYKHKFETVVSIDTAFGSSYAFYKFRMPRTVVRTNILQLIEEYKRVSELGDLGPEHTHLLKFRKLGQPISNLKGVLRQSMHRQTSEEHAEQKADNKTSQSTGNQKQESRFKSLRRIKLDRSKSTDLNGQMESKKRSKYLKRQLGKVFAQKSYEQSSDEESEMKIEPESCSLASTLGSSEDETLDSNQATGTESDIDEQYDEIVEEHQIEIREETILVDNRQSENFTLKSNFYVTLFITFVSIVIFFILALNNFKKLSSIERKILELI